MPAASFPRPCHTQRRLCVVGALLGALLWGGCGARSAEAAPVYALTDLGTLGGDASYAYGLNDRGEIVGEAQQNRGLTRAFLYSDGGMRDLGTLGGLRGYANGLNAGGQVVGEAETVEDIGHAFAAIEGTITDLGTLGGSDANSSASAINESGQIVGYSDTATGDVHAFLWSEGTLLDLGTLGGSNSFAYGINGSGQIVGYANTANDDAEHAFLRTNGVMTDLRTLGGVASYAYGINASGQVVGVSDNKKHALHAFVFRNGAMQDLGTLGGRSSHANAINDHGQIVGASDTPIANATRAFLYQSGVITDLNELISDTSWTLLEATGINNSGQIVGYGSHDGVEHAFLLTPPSARLKGQVSQFVTDSTVPGGVSKQPLSGVTITCRDEGGFLATATSGATGAYSFAPLPPGRYTLTASKAAPSGPPWQFAPSQWAVALEGSDLLALDFASYSLSGTVYKLAADGKTHQPLANAQVLLGDGRQTTTDSAGFYLVPGLGKGNLRVQPKLSGYKFASKTVTLPTSGIDGTSPNAKANFQGTAVAPAQASSSKNRF